MVKQSTQKFPRTNRLVHPRQFKSAYEHGTKINAKHFVLYALKNDLPHSRLGMTVSKKIGKSVVRSRAKRLIREVFRKDRDILKSNYDLVINAKRSLASISYWELEEDFHKAIERLQHGASANEVWR